MSEQNKPGGDDPFAGLDWDAELENWDESTAQPGGAEVPTSFSQPPPKVLPAPVRAIPPPEPAAKAGDDLAAKLARPLYRPPAGLRKSGAIPPAAPPPARSSARPLPSLIDEPDNTKTPVTNALPTPSPPAADDEGGESGDVSERVEKPDVDPAVHEHPTRPLTIDVGAMDDTPDERTEEHARPREEDQSVVTSAPDVATTPRAGSRAATGAKPATRVDAPMSDGRFDPFQGMDVDPPASEAMRPHKLLEPEQRRYSAEELTAISDTRPMIAAARARMKPDPDATLETPFAHDPFATSDPFVRQALGAPDADAVLTTTEEDAEAAGIIDLLHGDDASSDALPAVATFDTKRASNWVQADAEIWRGRVQRIANDARTLDKNRKARALIVASELAAIVGDDAVALELAEEAWNESPSEPLAVRQLRQLLAAQGRWDEVAPLLDGEIKSGATPDIKAHSALLAADVARVARSSPEEATKLYEAAQRVAANDVRPSIARAAAAIAREKPLPMLRWPQGIGAEPLGEAVARRARGGEPAEDVQLATVLEGVALYAENGTMDTALAHALDELAASSSLGGAAKWVRIALDAVRSETRRAAFERLTGMDAGRARNEGRILLGIDLGEIDAAREAAAAIAAEHPAVGTIVTQHTLAALAHETAAPRDLVPFAEEPGVRVVGRGLSLAADEDVNPAFAADDALDASSRVARRLTTGGHVDASLREKTSRGAQFGFALADALGGGGPQMTVEALAPLVAWDAAPADEHLLRSLAALADDDLEAAIEAVRQAAAMDPTGFPAALAMLGFAAPDAEAIALAAAEGTAEEGRGAMLALRVALAAIRRDDLEAAKRAAEISQVSQPDDPVAPFIAELRARRGGDFDGLIDAIRARAAVATDPIAKANNYVREIFLLLGSDPAACGERAHEAWQQVPRDFTVRALYERIAGDSALGRAQYRAELAERLTGAAKAEALLDAAREAERSADFESAERYAAQAEAAGSGAEAITLRHRVQSRSEGAARLAEELLEVAKRAEDPESQREVYEKLADLDLFARGDTVSAIMWHQAILEGSPDHLPSLRRLEHMLISVGREDDYEAVASHLARVLPEESREAHAEVAARLRLRRPGAEWSSVADLIDAAAERETPSLWVTRMMDALARVRGDDRTALRAFDLLLARVERPAEVAALSTRAAEAAFRLGDVARATNYLDRALAADPQHPTALASVAELRRAAHDFRGAAGAIEQMAQNQVVREHQLEDWHAAAVIWLDKVKDAVRGRAALERAAEIDPGYADVFERLVRIARAAGENEIVNQLYEQRLTQIDDPALRAQLLVEHAKLLIEIGDRDAARAALAAALEAQPTNVLALEEGLRLAEEAEDWPEYEQFLIKSSKAQTDDATQVTILKRLGALYEGPLPNPSRAEAVYRKILTHEQDNDEILGRLVSVYIELGDADMAVETHQERVRLATEPAARRARLLDLAQLLDEHANDPDRALKALEQARASDLSDLDALAALAEFHTRHGRPGAVAAALDQAIEDLRGRIAADPEFELFQHLAKILELRGREDAVTVVRAAVAGLSGEPSPLIGAEDAAAMPELDSLLCPAELSDELRAFLEKAGEALEKAVPVDLRALKAAKLGTTNPILKAKIDAVARGFGLPDPDVVISRAMPLLCLPVGAKPFQIVVGDGIVNTEDEVARRFSLGRTMKLCGARCAALIRVPPADLKVYIDALMHHLHEPHPAPELDAERLEEITKRLQRFVPKKDEAEMRRLAAELDARGPLNVEELAAAASSWGDRVALLAVGDLAAALRGVAWTIGQKDIPGDPAAMREWLRENPAARDLVLFAISDTYVEARKRAGMG